MDPDQRPVSRGDPAGEGQGGLPGDPQGPEGRPGPTESLGRKLSGESLWNKMNNHINYKCASTHWEGLEM